ncbi:MAG: hypothetical protein R3199_10070 [Gemmatimonadota bacterium]|nr:hypothetical protein [Gemmatimonadota bacterium]
MQKSRDEQDSRSKRRDAVDYPEDWKHFDNPEGLALFLQEEREREEAKAKFEEALRAFLERPEPPPLSPKPIAARLPTWLDEELRSLFESTGEGPSVGLRRIAIEWWVRETFPRIEFRDGEKVRGPAVVDGPTVARLRSAWYDAGLEYAGDERAEERFLRDHGISREELEQALVVADVFWQLRQAIRLPGPCVISRTPFPSREV